MATDDLLQELGKVESFLEFLGAQKIPDHFRQPVERVRGRVVFLKPLMQRFDSDGHLPRKDVPPVSFE